MSHPRLPASPVMRCALVISIGVCVCVLLLIPVLGALLMTTVFDNSNPPPLPPTAVAAAAPAAEVADSHAVQLAPVPPRSPGVNSALVGSQVADMVAGSQQQSAKENLRDLDKMSRQLNSVASDESVDDLANNFQRWMGLEARAAKPKAVTKVNEFEVDSAQLHDVKRQERAPGKFEYSAVLIDARGGTLEIQMTEAEGRETYELMRRVKANPLLEKIYRRIAMPLLDNLVQSARDQKKSPPPVRTAP